MGLIKRLNEKYHKFNERFFRRIRNYRSIITKEEVEKYKESSKKATPDCHSVIGLGLKEVLIAGTDLMKKDNFTIASEGLKNL